MGGQLTIQLTNFLVPMMRIERMTSPLPRECSTTELHRPNRSRFVLVDSDSPGLGSAGAGEGSRTLVVSLEGFCSTIELHPLTGTDSRPKTTKTARALAGRTSGVGCRFRTYVVAWPTDLQPGPCSRSGTPPNETPDYRGISLWCQTPSRSAQAGPGRQGRGG